MKAPLCGPGRVLLLFLALSVRGQVASGPRAPTNKEAAAALNLGRRALAAKQYAEAERRFRQALGVDAADVNARMGLADAELGLHRFESAELDYRTVVAAEPQMWVAHKNLVIVEAALGRWEEFDRERALLRDARERGATGISALESDVIDGFTAGGRRWIVREYFVPVGRLQTRYNFVSFEADGRAGEYISLENEGAAPAALDQEQGIRVGACGPETAPGSRFALNWYTGRAHGVVRVYPAMPGGPPTYEQVRADVMRFLRSPKGGATR